MSDEWTLTGYRPGLNVRLDWWARRRGGRLRIGIERIHGEGLVTARIGVFVGKGRTSTEALNQLADELVGEGWEDDRRAVGRVAA